MARSDAPKPNIITRNSSCVATVRGIWWILHIKPCPFANLSRFGAWHNFPVFYHDMQLFDAQFEEWRTSHKNVSCLGDTLMTRVSKSRNSMYHLTALHARYQHRHASFWCICNITTSIWAAYWNKHTQTHNLFYLYFMPNLKTNWYNCSMLTCGIQMTARGFSSLYYGCKMFNIDMIYFMCSMRVNTNHFWVIAWVNVTNTLPPNPCLISWQHEQLIRDTVH